MDNDTATISLDVNQVQRKEATKMPYNFTTLERHRFGSSAKLSQVVRVSKRAIGVSGDVMDRFKHELSPSGRAITALAVRIDDHNQAIEIGPPRDNEDSFRFVGGQVASSNGASGYATINKPVGFKEHAIPNGDYVEVDHNVFVLAK